MADISLQYLDQILNTLSVSYENNDFWAERLFPPVPVDRQTGRYWVYAKEKFRRYETIRAAGSESREIAPWSVVNQNYYCDDRSLKDKITDEERANSAVPQDLEINTVENLTDSILLDLELRATELILGTSVPAASPLVPSTTLSGTSQWSDFVNSDPVNAVEAQRLVIQKAVAKDPNTFFVSKPVHVILRQHPKIIDRFKYTWGQNPPHGFLDSGELAQVFGVQNYWVADCLYDTAAEGVTPTLDYIWGKNALLAVIEPPKLRSITMGICPRWLFGAPDLGGTLTKRYRKEEKTCDVIEVHRFDDLQFAVATAAYLFVNAVA